MSETLYSRLGGLDGVTRIAGNLIDQHARNPQIAKRFAGSNLSQVKQIAAAFFSTGSGGPDIYQGKDMIAAHKGMNISPAEFLAVLDDAVAAMKICGVAQREQEEVVFIFFSMKDNVVAQ